MIKVKHEKDMEGLLLIHPALLMILADLALYAQINHGIDLTLTATVSTEEEDKRLGRRSSAHRDRPGRAVDIRTKDINAFVIQDLVQYINKKEEYKNYRYMSYSGIERLAYLHTGTHEHIHLAIRKLDK